MLGFNDEFKNGKTRVTKAWLDITLSDSTVLNLDESRVMFNGLTRDTSTTMDGEFTVGAAVTTKLTVTLDNSDGALDAYDFRGAVIVAWLGGILSDESVQKVNVGRYNVSEYSYDGANVTLTALDDLCKFDVQCNQTVTWASGKTIADLVGLACSAAGISLYNNSLPGPANYTVVQMPEQWETMTWHDVISYCAQLMGCYARMVYVPSPGTWKLKFDWYDMGPLSPSQYDGGTYNTTTTPYSDGATLDGGSFNPWNTGDVADGGTFHDRDDTIILPSPYDMTVDTDDVMITGVTVTLDPSDNIEADDDTKTYTTDIVGSAGYVINIEDNPLIETTAQADIVAAYIGALINGMRFRPMTVSAIEDPSLEAGDTALITDRNGNTYAIFLSHVTYTVNASTQISCDAQSTMQNLKSRFSGAQKTRAMIQRTVEKTASDAENAMSGIIGALATTMGLYKFEETAPDGGTIYKFGDAQTLAQSTKIWRFSAGALTVSNDGGTTWSGALTADGIAVLQALYAVKVNADLIEAGAFTTKDISGHETFYADTQTGTVRINADSLSIRGTTINDTINGSIANNNKSQWGTCSTNASTTTKVVVCQDFVGLYAGKKITVKFQHKNTAAGAMLNVNYTGNIPIRANGLSLGVDSPFNWSDDAIIDFTYDGTYWVMSDSVALSAKPSYGTCSTGVIINTKTVSLDGFVLYKGAKISVLFSKGNNAANPSLDVNNTGAKYIRIRGAAPTSKDYWKDNAVVDFIYDGTYWEMCNVESQQEIFNRLTASDNGNQQGIYLDNGKLYLNFEYAQGQTLKLGGIDDTNGLLEVYNASGTKIVIVDKLGVRNTKESITDRNDGFILNSSGLSIGDFSVSPVRRYVESKTYGTLMFGDAQLDYLWGAGYGNGELIFTTGQFTLEAENIFIHASSSFYMCVGDDSGSDTACRSIVSVMPPYYYGGVSARYGVRFDLQDQIGHVAHHYRETSWYAYNE